ncbi:CDP-diacylglycerol-phosphatidylglycerolphosphati dyltransferase [Beutenbergia cavernae DSM 12333]|uniref:CDP-diacylglycerol-phosphatidylglycerolphosphati dyltransferase n=1 Tax=Beutenbergia cavernae (strain ATCC BAA-8 / DSM 12333 / CCUG 43141 / JCM 11478 / NBRC 16432 / NCIMB 13614 / HKI 0122) TaxID=471853 RepID=C5C6F3_BEUC1|nr:hypothetical protein [Beutenbergia cavernae]ACQ80359.1 CDP-diacylglycerol-phosphatidylglycerolphosphati dyltransferase [Beutenbergia cavernae DSM 12333]
MGPATSVDARTLGRVAVRVCVALAYVALAWAGAVPWWFVIVLGARDLLLVCTIPSLRSRGYRGYPVHAAGTVAVAALAVGAAGLAVGLVPGTWGTVGSVVGWTGAGWGALVSWYGAVLYVRQLAGVLAEPGLSVGPAR